MKGCIARYFLNYFYAYIVILLLSIPGVTVAKTLNIYLSPTGSDIANGMTESQPIATLKRAQDLVAANVSGHDEVRILFASGIYRGQGVKWTTFPGVWIRFMPAEKVGVVKFDGRRGRESVFFQGLPPEPNRSTTPVAMKLEFRNLIIQYYCEGISLRSWSDDVRVPGGQENLLINNRFEYIGSKYDPIKRNGKPRGGCTAALRLQGVGKNRVEKNIFSHIINVPRTQTGLNRYGPVHLHAIYISNISQDNNVVRNRFDDFSGDPIRIRDKSDRNVIAENVFGSASEQTPSANVHAISQWYCNENVKACVNEHKNRRECASESIELHDNHIEGANVAAYADRAEGRATCAK